MKLSVPQIKVDGGTQSRESLNNEVIEDYAQSMIDGAAFPAITVFYDGSDYWLADGFHRYHACIKAGLDCIDADVKQGDRRQAILFSVGANAMHGLRRTNADKRRAVMRLLEDDEWKKWSDREIGRRCGVFHQMVATLRRSLDDSSSQSQQRTYTDRHGNTSTMNVGGIGKSSKRDSEEEEGGVRPGLSPLMSVGHLA